MKTNRKKTAAPKPTRRTAALSLSARMERLEKAVLIQSTPPAIPAQRFMNLVGDGAPTKGDHVAVYDRKTGLTWSAGAIRGGKALTHAAAMEACAELDLLGHHDWRAPTVEELLAIVDYTRCDPAVNTGYFKGPFGWTWSSTRAASPSGCAWGVNLVGGYSGRGLQSGRLRVRAVRAGQQLGLSA